MSFQGYVDSANSNVGLYKYGLLVILNFSLILNSGTGQTWYYIGDVPSDYLPNVISTSQDIRVSVTSQNGYSYSFALNNAGNMYLVSNNNALVSGDIIRFQVAYLTYN